jgi:hypothetical protein
VPSPAIRALGGANPHAEFTPLRQAMYAVLGLSKTDSVTELWPEWSEGSVTWAEQV